MRIVHINTLLDWRGGEQQIAYLCLEIHKEGMEQVIVCRKKGRLEAFCQKEGLPCIGLKKRTPLDLSFAHRLVRIARIEKSDIVHLHDSHAHTFGIMAARLFGMKTPIVLHRRVDYSVKNSVASHYKYNHSQVKKIICVSHEVKRILDKKLEDHSRSIVVYGGIDLEKFDRNSNLLRKEFGIHSSKSLIGNVAAITQQKDYFTFVAIAQKILQKTQQVHFFVIGDGDQRSEITTLVQQKGLASHFTFTGFRNDIYRVLPSLDILLFPSEKEGLGTTILDAFAARVAVVTSNVGGIPELISHGQNGMMAERKNPDKLAQYCLQLLEQPELRQKLVHKALHTVQSFSKENMARKVLAVYREVLKLSL